MLQSLKADEIAAENKRRKNEQEIIKGLRLQPFLFVYLHSKLLVMDGLKDMVEIETVIKKKPVKIKGIANGLLPIGNFGYDVRVWDNRFTSDPELISKFTIDFKGDIYNPDDALNLHYCLENDLPAIIITNARGYKDGMMYRYEIIGGNYDEAVHNEAARIKQNVPSSMYRLFIGQTVGFTIANIQYEFKIIDSKMNADSLLVTFMVAPIEENQC